MKRFTRLPQLLALNHIYQFIIRLFSTWILTAFFSSLGQDSFLTLSYCSNTNLISYLFLFLLMFAILTLVRTGWNLINDEIILLFATLLYGSRCLSQNDDVYLLFGICFFFFMIFCYCYPNIKNYTLNLTLSKKQYLLLLFLFFCFSTIFIGGITIIRYLSSSSSTFDMGIFVQTFYNLKEHFTQNNTCERNQYLSHLQVHTSLIYYLFTPIYWLFPKPQTLLMLQALSVSTGLIPLTLLCKQKKLSKKVTLCMAFVYILSPAASGGCFYDFHENVFLLPLLLWMFYCYESRHNKLLYLLVFAVCTVKEDATLFVLVFGIYLLLCKGKAEFKTSLGLICFSLLYMGGAFYYLANYGLGLMTYRYDNIMCNDSLLSIFKTFLTNPAYLFTQVFNVEKWEFTLLLILPLAGIMFVTKKYQRLLLLIPLLFINLLPDYEYMHSVFFQYVFGPFAFVLYLCVMNLAEMNAATKKKLLLLAMTFSMFAFSSQLWQKTQYINSYRQNTDTRKSITAVLEQIPEDASITASTFFVPQLGNREEIYMIDDNEIKDGITYNTDYVVFDLRPNYTSDAISDAITVYEQKGYKEVSMVENTILLLKRK